MVRTDVPTNVGSAVPDARVTGATLKATNEIVDADAPAGNLIGKGRMADSDVTRN